MRGTLFFLVAIGLSRAWAGFYLPDNLPERPENLERALKATVRLSMTNSTASAFFISSQGHLLTNLHVLSRCTTPTYDYTPAQPMERVTKEHYSFLKILEQYPRDPLCPPWAKNELYLWSLKVGKPKTIWFGRGYGTFIKDKVLDMDESELKTFAGLFDDYVILKYDISSEDFCIPVERKGVQPGDKIWAVGFPGWTRRPDGLSATGSDQMITYGQVRRSILEDPILPEFLTGTEDDRLAKVEKLRAIYEQERLVLTDVDAYGGNSGGPMINAQGNGVAVLMSTFKTSQDSYIGASVLGLSLSYIYDEVVKGLGQSPADEIFDCSHRPTELASQQ